MIVEQKARSHGITVYHANTVDGMKEMFALISLIRFDTHVQLGSEEGKIQEETSVVTVCKFICL